MSIEQNEPSEIETAATEETKFDELSSKIGDAVEERVAHTDALDLGFLAKRLLGELKEFKTMRKEMIGKRDALNRSITILDRRIEMTLSSLKTLQTPL